MRALPVRIGVKRRKMMRVLPVRFGVNIDPLASDPHWPLLLAKTIERVNLDFACVQDHPYQVLHLDMWTTITTLTQSTSTLRFFPNVTNSPLRPPTLLAKAAATLDILSNGRVELGIGAGASGFWPQIEAMGGPAWSPGQAVNALEEAVTIIRSCWAGQPFSFAGTYYSVKNFRPGPTPTHPIEIWVGALGPRMLQLTGRLADGWIPSSIFIPPEQLAEKNQQIDEAAIAAGRHPSAIRRIYNIFGHITPDSEGGRAGEFHGSIVSWVQSLLNLVEQGIDTFIYWPNSNHVQQIEIFGEEIAPRVREAIAPEQDAG